MRLHYLLYPVIILSSCSARQQQKAPVVSGTSEHVNKVDSTMSDKSLYKDGNNDVIAGGLKDKPSEHERFVIDVAGGDLDIPLRKRPLNKAEISIANSGSDEGKRLNKESIITYLPNGIDIEVIQVLDWSYYINAHTLGGAVKGYIVKGYAGKSTIKKIGLATH
jgi:hypothetical protein